MYQHRCTVPFWDASHPTQGFVRWRIPTRTDSNTAGIMALTSEGLRLFFLAFCRGRSQTSNFQGANIYHLKVAGKMIL